MSTGQPGPWKKTHLGLNDDEWSRGPYSIRPVGSNASGKNMVWGLYRDGKEFTEHSRFRGGTDLHVTFDKLSEGKKKADRLLVKDGLLDASALPVEPKRPTARDRLAEVERARSSLSQAASTVRLVLCRDSRFLNDFEKIVLEYLLKEVEKKVDLAHTAAVLDTRPL